MLSIIMPTYNNSDYLTNTLKGFTHQTCQDYQLVIVDDGSSDNTENVMYIPIGILSKALTDHITI